jgi:hypothetical protein
LEQAVVLTMRDRQARRDAQTKLPKGQRPVKFTVRERETLARHLATLDRGIASTSAPVVPAPHVSVASTPAAAKKESWRDYAPDDYSLSPKQRAEIDSREGWMQFGIDDAKTFDRWLAETRAIDPNWRPTSYQAVHSLYSIQNFRCNEDARQRELEGKPPRHGYSYDAELHDKIRALKETT